MTQHRAAGDLLASLAAQSLDDDYAVVAARPGGGQPGRSGVRSTALTFGVCVAALGVLLTVSAVRTRDDASQAEADREALISRIQQAQTDVGGLQRRVEELGAGVDRLRAASLRSTGVIAAVQDRLGTLQAVTGTVPVSGPGVRITVDDSAAGHPQGRIRDTDLQLLANGLWQAGAEAVAISGQRLTTRSAIRTAALAITVNYRSLTPPYVVTAIGDPDTLPADFLETSAGQAFTDLRANFGIGFKVEPAGSLTLPGRELGISAAQPDAAVGTPPDPSGGPP